MRFLRRVITTCACEGCDQAVPAASPPQIPARRRAALLLTTPASCTPPFFKVKHPRSLYSNAPPVRPERAQRLQPALGMLGRLNANARRQMSVGGEDAVAARDAVSAHFAHLNVPPATSLMLTLACFQVAGCHSALGGGVKVRVVNAAPCCPEWRRTRKRLALTPLSPHQFVVFFFFC